MREVEKRVSQISEGFYRFADVLIPFPRGSLLKVMLRLANSDMSLEGEDTSSYYQKFFQKAEKEILLVSGGRNAETLTQDHVAYTLETISRDINLEIIFTTEVDIPENSEFKYFVDSGRANIFRVFSEPESINFCVVDRNHILLAEKEDELTRPLRPGESLPVSIYYKMPDAAILWARNFEHLKNYQ